MLSHLRIFVTPWTVARQVSMSTGILQARILEWVAMPSSFQPRIKLRSVTLQADSLPTEPQGKPKNMGMGSLSLLQRNFPTQGLNQSLLHCRQILYQLSYQGSPKRDSGISFFFSFFLPRITFTEYVASLLFSITHFTKAYNRLNFKI